MFELKIELGNDAMSTPADIATALRRAAYAIEYGGSSGVIHDDNGNSVGEWKRI